MKLLSLIILTYNSEKDIYDCLKSVYQYNDIGNALEIIIVDNNSINYAEMHDNIKSLYPDIKIIANDKNGGYGQGNNVGIRISKAPIVAIMNPDVRLIMPTFLSILKQFEDENVIMCAGRQYSSLITPTTSYWCDYHRNPIYQSIFYNYYRKHNIYKPDSMWLSGAFFAIQKVVFEQIGLFDETLFMYGEEYDIHLRILKKFPNKTIKYLKGLKYLHLIEGRVISREEIRKPLTSIYYVCKKHNLSPKKVFKKLLIVSIIQYVKSQILRLLKRPYDSQARKKIIEHHQICSEILSQNS